MAHPITRAPLSHSIPSHEFDSKRICKQWKTTGRCTFGHRCLYFHPGEDASPEFAGPLVDDRILAAETPAQTPQPDFLPCKFHSPTATKVAFVPATGNLPPESARRHTLPFASRCVQLISLTGPQTLELAPALVSRGVLHDACVYRAPVALFDAWGNFYGFTVPPST